MADEDPSQFALSDGITVIVVRRPASPYAVAIGLVVRVRDSVAEKQGGLAHFVEHLLSKHLRDDLFPKFVGASPDHCGGQTELEQIYLQWGDPPGDKWLLVVSAFVEAVRHPLDAVTDAAFAQERAAILAEMTLTEAGAGADEAWLDRAMLRQAFGNHPLGVGDPAGLSSHLESVTANDVRQYIAPLLKAQNCAIVVTLDGERQYLSHDLEALHRL
jgi:predicted Zn-dependent peptidase